MEDLVVLIGTNAINCVGGLEHAALMLRRTLQIWFLNSEIFLDAPEQTVSLDVPNVSIIGEQLLRIGL